MMSLGGGLENILRKTLTELNKSVKILRNFSFQSLLHHPSHVVHV